MEKSDNTSTILTDLFEQKQQHLLDQLDYNFKKFKIEAEEKMETEMKLLEFEIAYAISVPVEKQTKTTEQLRKFRNERWNKTIEKAKGNEEKAFTFYVDPSF